MNERLQELLELELPKIDRAELSIFRLALVSPFETSFGSIDHREIVLCKLQARGLTAYGESAADEDPLYSYETTSTNWEMLEHYLLPQLRHFRTIGQYLKLSAQY